MATAEISAERAGPSRVFWSDRWIEPSILEGTVGSLARELAAAGVGAGDEVRIAMAGGVSHLVALLACFELRARVAEIAPTSSLAVLNELVGPTCATGVILDEATAARVGREEGARRFVTPFADHPIVSFVPTHRPPVAEWTSSTTRLWGAQPHPVFYSSGSTGTAKGIELRWDTILERGAAVLDEYRASPRDVVLPILPMSHVYSVYLVLAALERSVPLALAPESGGAPSLMSTLRKAQASIVVCPPTVGAFLFGRRPPDKQIVDTLRVLSQGGAAARRADLEAIIKNIPKTRVYSSYGLVETYSTLACCEISKYPGKIGSVGWARFGVTVEIRNPETGSSVFPGTEGEVCVRGPRAERYVASAADIALTSDGLFRTGDLGRIDADGFLWITGRLKSMINLGGLSLDPAEVEECFAGHPLIDDAGLTAIEQHGLEVPVLCVVPRQGPADGETRRRALFEHARAVLSPKMVPKRILDVERIPRGALGKIQRAELARLVRELLAH